MKQFNHYKISPRLLFAVLLVMLGILFRTTWHLGPNVEFVTSATLLAGTYLGREWAILIPLIIMTVSDTIIGNTSIFIFTWSAYVMIGLVGQWKLKEQKIILPWRDKKQRTNLIMKMAKVTSLGAIASFWFFLWTNFGVWLLDSWGMYPKTSRGLLDAYILGLPFLKYNLLGNLVLVPSAFFIVETSKTIISVPLFRHIRKSYPN